MNTLRLTGRSLALLLSSAVLALSGSGCQSKQAETTGIEPITATAAPEPKVATAVPDSPPPPQPPDLEPVAETTPALAPAPVAETSPTIERFRDAAAAVGQRGTRAVDAASGAVDRGLRRTAGAVEQAASQAAAAVDIDIPAPSQPAPATTPATTPTPTESPAIPAAAAPVVEAAKEQVDAAVGELGRGVQAVTDGVRDGVRQTASEIGQGVRQKADGLKDTFRQKADKLGEKARGATYRATSDLVKKLGDETRGAVDQGVKAAKDTVKGVVPPPAPRTPPTPAPGR